MIVFGIENLSRMEGTIIVKSRKDLFPNICELIFLRYNDLYRSLLVKHYIIPEIHTTLGFSVSRLLNLGTRVLLITS